MLHGPTHHEARRIEDLPIGRLLAGWDDELMTAIGMIFLGNTGKPWVFTTNWMIFLDIFRENLQETMFFFPIKDGCFLQMFLETNPIMVAFNAFVATPQVEMQIKVQSSSKIIVT